MGYYNRMGCRGKGQERKRKVGRLQVQQPSQPAKAKYGGD